MKARAFVNRLQNFLRGAAFVVIFCIAFFVTIGMESAYLQAAEDPGSGTVPPLARFNYAASPDRVQQGQTITFAATIVNTDTNYVNVVLGFTGTLPAGATVITSTVSANSGEIGIDASGQVTWTGALMQPGTILISYQAAVDANTCGDKVSQAVIYEIKNVGAGGPSSEKLIQIADFTVEGQCPLYLPNVSRAPLPTIPHLQNWDFEQGPDAPGWTQFDNGKPSRLIYSTDQKQLNPPPPDGKWFGWLGGLFNNTGELRQTITLPADHSGIELHFRYMIGSVDDCGGKDNGFVLIGGTQVGPTYELCKANADVWNQAKIPLPTSSLGKPVELVLRAVTNDSKNSNWFVDNVRLCSTDPRGPGGSL